MTFTLEFIRLFGLGLLLAAPLLLFLIIIIAAIGLMVGRREGWSRTDSLYYAFITASTVGYGDFHPLHKVFKFWAIGIALLGLILTGLVVAMGVQAATAAFVVANPHVADKLSSI